MQSQTRPAVLCKSLKHPRKPWAAAGVANEDHPDSGWWKERHERERETAASSVWGRWCVQTRNKRELWGRMSAVCGKTVIWWQWLTGDLCFKKNWLCHFFVHFGISGHHLHTSIGRPVLQHNSYPARRYQRSASWRRRGEAFWPVHCPEASCWLIKPASPAHLKPSRWFTVTTLPKQRNRSGNSLQELWLPTLDKAEVEKAVVERRRGKEKQQMEERDLKCKEEKHEEETGVWQHEVMKRAGVWKMLLERGAVAWKTNLSCFNRCRLSAECWTRCLHPYSQTSVHFFFYLASLSKLRWREPL